MTDPQALSTDLRCGMVVAGTARSQVLLAMRKFGTAVVPETVTGDFRAPNGLEDEVWTYPQFYRLLRKEVERSQAGERTFSLLMFDIDGIERHMEIDGEKGLAELNKTLAEALILVAPSGAFLGHTGRVEYALILPDMPNEDAMALGERVQANSEWYFKTTFGTACYPTDGADAESLITQTRSQIQSIRE